jgi:hypothetical protein
MDAALKPFLLWCTVINYAVLIVWFVAFGLARDFLYRMHTRWFRLTPEAFDAVHYGGLALYKLGILLFNLVPLLALVILGRP